MQPLSSNEKPSGSVSDGAFRKPVILPSQVRHHLLFVGSLISRQLGTEEMHHVINLEA